MTEVPIYEYDEQHSVRLMERVSASVWAVMTVPLHRDGADGMVTAPVPADMSVHRIETVDPAGNVLWWHNLYAPAGAIIRVPHVTGELWT